MAGIADLFYMGQPDPRMALASALGQGPGSPARPNPMVAAAGGPPAAGAAPPPPTGGAAVPPQGPPQAPPIPMAYQSPPDLQAGYQRLADPAGLMGLYLQLEQRQQAQEGINRGIGMMLAGFARPQDRAMMIGASSGMTPDAGGQMGDLLKLYQFNFQMRQQAALQRAAPQLAAATGLTPDEIIAGGPDLMRSVATSLAGVSGDPAVQAQTRDRNQWLKDNAQLDASGAIQRDVNNQPILKPGAVMPEKLTNIERYKADVAGQVANDQQRAKDLVADKANFAPAKDAYDRMIGDVQQLLKEPGLNNIVGPVSQWTGGAQALGGGDAARAKALYDKIMATQYSAGVQDFRGAGRITQQELKQDFPSQSILGSRNLSPDDFRAGAQDYLDKLSAKRANLFGAAGQLNSPDLSNADYNKLDPIYKPGGDLYVQGQASRKAAPSGGEVAGSDGAPVNVNTIDDVKKLPSGTLFVIPEGAHKGEIGRVP